MQYMSLFRLLLFPFSALYGAIVKIRNLMYDWGVFQSVSVGVPTICIGNLTVGGTGKTPLVEYVADLLSFNINVAILSRGYKRSTKGFQYVGIKSTANEVGDEPLQIKTKFPQLTVAVNGNRVEGANRIHIDNPGTKVIILDDAFQHRRIKSGFSILLVDYHRPIWNDFFLPTGNLRDSFRERRRADAIIFTKCPPGLSDQDRRDAIARLTPQRHQSIFFSTIKYGALIPLFPEACDTKILGNDTEAIAFTGIASPYPFFKYIEGLCLLRGSVLFSDHHFFSKKEIRAIFEKFLEIGAERKLILTTEKDAMRLKGLNIIPNEMKPHLHYIPIKVVFDNDGQQDFNNKIIEYVRTSKANNGAHKG
jgi:tetraacyldisaccharide 4'-kinase